MLFFLWFMRIDLSACDSCVPWVNFDTINSMYNVPDSHDAPGTCQSKCVFHVSVEGMSEAKIAKFGPYFISHIRSFCKENSLKCQEVSR